MPILLLTIFLDLLGFGLLIPLLPFIARDFGATPFDVTMLIASYSLGVLLTGPIWGRISDRWGRKPVLLIAFCGTALAFTILAFADGLWMLFLGRAIAGLSSGDVAAAPGYVADVTDPKDRARKMGYLGAAFALAFIIGPIISANMTQGNVSDGAFRLPLIISACLSAAALVIATLFLKEPQRHRPQPEAASGPAQWVKALHFPFILPVIGLVLFFGLVFAAVESTLALWVESELHWSTQEFGYLLAYGGVAAVVSMALLVGPVTRHLGEIWTVGLGALLLGAGVLLVPIGDYFPFLFVDAKLPPFLVLAVTGISMGIGLINPTLQSLISKLSGKDKAGGALGLSQATANLARAVGPLLAGLAFERVGVDYPYLFSAILVLFAGGIVVWLWPRVRGF